MTSLVAITHRQVMTTSLLISEQFHKKHKDVLKAVDNLLADLPAVSRRNFAPRDYVDERGKLQPIYEISRDGFALLAMGFTGKRALTFKLAFIDAFNRMEAVLQNQKSLEWQQTRIDGKGVRRKETDVIADFVAYAKNQGSRHAGHYYQNLTKTTNKCLGIEAQASGTRNGLDVETLAFIQTAEIIVRQAITDGMRQLLYYKDIYQLASDRLQVLGASLMPCRSIENNRKAVLL